VHVAGAHVNVGILYMLAVAALGVYGVTLGGYASNNKYSFLGGLRATAQMISYEIPLGMSLLAVLLIVGSIMPDELINHQVLNGWGVFAHPIVAFIFYVAILAEANRAPFDNAEAEQELVGGYHTEYSSMRFALFFLAEYSHLTVSSAFFVMIFLGGWHLPLFVDGHLLTAENTTLLAVLAKCTVFFSKVIVMVLFSMVIRWSLPRLRYDQVMQMAWQAIIPVSLLVLVVYAVLVHMGWKGTAVTLAANIAMAGLILMIQPLMPKVMSNKAIPLYGSRFRPMPGEVVRTRAHGAIATEDRPIQGTAATN
jgi:NADH-quinone oxidoreductase subunit H